jgi:hypothetical protein
VKRILAACLVVIAPRAALAATPESASPPFSFPYFARTLVGGGGVPLSPEPFVTVTGEIGQHPLTGALLSGVSISTAASGRTWSVTTPGIFARLDLTYLFRSGFWTVPPPRSWIHLQLGSRVGLGFSKSFHHVPVARAESNYDLWRPEVESTFDCEMWPFDEARFRAARHYAFVLRGAVDTSVDLSELLRWSFAIGLNYGWGGE